MKDIQLFCIPYAGGNASFFNNLKKYLEDSVEVYNLEYSGHGIRRREAFYHDFEEAVNSTVSVTKEYQPDMEKYAIYEQGYRTYLELYRRLEPMMKK